jgi:hypothetical protein
MSLLLVCLSVLLSTRGIYNNSVGLNIGAFQEAAEHLLSALSMQKATAGQTSDQLWFTLRRVFQEMVKFFSSCIRLRVLAHQDISRIELIWSI